MHTRHLLFPCLLLSLCFFQVASAQDGVAGNTGMNMLGIRISSSDATVNHSVTYKRFLNPALAIEGLVSFSNPGAIGVLLEKHHPFGPAGVSWFLGAGAYTGFDADRRFGTQGILGLDLISTRLPLNFSVDWKPELNIVKTLSFEPAAVGFSARFVF